MYLRVHSTMSQSRANGPGIRYVVWLQGCSLACEGCFNPDTHDPLGGYLVTPESTAAEMLALNGRIQGVTISGGEPLEQMDGIIELLGRIRDSSTLSVIVFTGHTWEDVCAMPRSNELVALTDVLIAGRYVATRRVAQGLVGSSNKTVHFLTNCYSQADLDGVPGAEVLVSRDGEITISGIHPPRSSK